MLADKSRLATLLFLQARHLLARIAGVTQRTATPTRRPRSGIIRFRQPCRRYLLPERRQRQPNECRRLLGSQRIVVTWSNSGREVD
jgi:hypothetical protein